MRLSLKLEEGRIVAARFRAKGCVPAIACGSRLAEMLEGRTLAEAEAVKREELVASLGGVPAASEHAGHLAMDALRAVLAKLK
jgi:NifU-like protein involved in Fe-S cluster formation